MFSRIIRIAAVLLGVILLAGGCVRRFDPDPAPEGESISFRAGSTLLRDDATKGTTPKEADGDVREFLVYGTKTVSGNRSSVFGGVSVTHNSNIWTYSPVRYWDANASRYEFLGVSGPESVNSSTTSPTISATLTYNPISTQYDLMAACDYRERNAGVLDMNSPVVMVFEHLLSAVSVVVYNDSPMQHISLVSYGFRNLYIRQNVRVTYYWPSPTSEWLDDATKAKDTSNPLLTWIANDVENVEDREAGRELDPGKHAPLYTQADADELDVELNELEDLNWDMMIPQTLNPLSSAPLLMVKYRLVDYSNDPVPVRTVSEPIETPIRLNTIQNSGGEDILEWEKGKKYIYEIHIRYGGGISVTVTTSDWDEVRAGTPGLIIS